MIQRHELGDETTHRRADHVRGRDPERIQQTSRVVGHIFERIPRVHAGREARVPVAETDDQEAATGEQGAEVVVPAEHLGAEPGDQQHRRRLRVAEGLVLDLDPVGCGSGHRDHATNRSVTKSLAARSEVDERFTWDADSVFPDHSGWELAVDTILSSLPDLEEFKGRLGDSPETLADWFEANERAHRLMAKVMVYSTMSYSVDVADQDAAARADRARSVAAQLGAAASFAVPEMLEIGIPKLREWVASSPRLAHLDHYFDRLEKLQKRIRSAEVEELLTQVSDPLASALAVHSVLANTDLKFAPAVGSDGELHEVAQGTIGALMTNADREVRRPAWRGLRGSHAPGRARRALGRRLPEQGQADGRVLHRRDGHPAFHLHELQRRHLLDEHPRARARAFDALLPREAHPALRLFELRAVPGRGRLQHAPGPDAPPPAGDEDRSRLPGRGDRGGDVELLSLLLHHAVACAPRAGDPRAGRARGRADGRLPEQPDGGSDGRGLRIRDRRQRAGPRTHRLDVGAVSHPPLQQLLRVPVRDRHRSRRPPRRARGRGRREGSRFLPGLSGERRLDVSIRWSTHGWRGRDIARAGHRRSCVHGLCGRPAG